MADQNIDQNNIIRYVQKAIQESGGSPETYVQLGQLAEQVLQDKNLYPQFVDQIVSSGIADKNELSPKMDLQAIVAMIAMGRVCQKMMQGAV